MGYINKIIFYIEKKPEKGINIDFCGMSVIKLKTFTDPKEHYE